LEAAIGAAKETGDTDQRRALQRKLAEYQKRMTETIAAETRVLQKERFPYPIFLYEAEKVGITATGDEDQNELCRYPKDNLPPGITKTCLEFYQDFRRNPNLFFISEGAK
jgi:type I restriction enzyme M protein